MLEQGTLEPARFVYRHRDGAGCEAGVRETMTAPFVLDGTMNGPIFLAYVKQCLAATLSFRDT
jgi:hypothetical protein